MSVRIDLSDAATFPTRRAEDWKYTDLRRVLREPPPPSPAIDVAAGGPFAALGGGELVFANGRTAGGAALTVTGEQTLRLRLVSDAAATGHTASVEVTVAPGARLTLLESHEGAGSAYVANGLIDLDIGAGASVTRIVLMDEPADAISICLTEVSLAEGASFSQTVLTGGARLQRHETRVLHPGAGASVRMDGAYLLTGKRHADITTAVDHTGPDGTTSQLTKGVVRDEGRGVFQGRIIVREGADGTDARMGHHALITSPRGEVDAKPELLIFADDVQCAHGNTVGALDESALFYMQSRGLPEEQARAMLTGAFLMEVVDRIDHEGARETARTWLSQRLNPLPQGEGG